MNRNEITLQVMFSSGHRELREGRQVGVRTTSIPVSRGECIARHLHHPNGNSDAHAQAEHAQYRRGSTNTFLQAEEFAVGTRCTYLKTTYARCIMGLDRKYIRAYVPRLF